MGLNLNGVRSLLYARSQGVDFSRTAMIGRQAFFLSPSEFRSCLAEFGFQPEEDAVRRMLRDSGGYADEFLRYLGAKEVHSFDYSAYEGATVLHDMNLEIPDRFKRQYSLVLDGGTLEHVFNFPTALRNCMEMVDIGGHYVALAPANNFMGHGFYQFSPELFFSAFTPANGYRLSEVIAFEDAAGAQWYSVRSPASVNGRVTLMNSRPVILLVIARRGEGVTPFASMPLESDYVSTWGKSAGGIREDEGGRSGLAALVWRRLPVRFREVVARWLGHFTRQSGFERRFFEPIDPAKSRAKTLS